MGAKELSLVEVLHREVQAEKDLSLGLAKYAGKWVAVRNHEIVAAADTLDDLLPIIEDEDVETVFEVQEQGAACFF